MAARMSSSFLFIGACTPQYSVCEARRQRSAVQNFREQPARKAPKRTFQRVRAAWFTGGMPAWQPSRGGGEPVARPVDRGDVARMGGVIFHLLPQARDVLVQGPGRPLVAHSPDLVHEGEPVQRLSLAGDEELEQGELPSAHVE